jgi:selenocysteine lyase/cysteine desulfurase
MADVKKVNQSNEAQVQVNINNNQPVLYTDSVFVTTGKFGVVLDFAQSMGSTNQQNVVARVGMSKEHALALLNVLEKKVKETFGVKSEKN